MTPVQIAFSAIATCMVLIYLSRQEHRLKGIRHLLCQECQKLFDKQMEQRHNYGSFNQSDYHMWKIPTGAYWIAFAVAATTSLILSIITTEVHGTDIQAKSLFSALYGFFAGTVVSSVYVSILKKREKTTGIDWRELNDWRQ